MRDLSQAAVRRTEFLVHFWNAMELRHERAGGGANSPRTPVEAVPHLRGQRFVAFDGDHDQGGMFGFTGRRLRQCWELQRGQNSRR